MPHHPKTLAAAIAAAGLTAAAPAAAHVTLQPKTAVAGEYTVESVRVPNETDDADTVRVDVRFPPGFASVSYKPVAGWKVRVTTKKLAVPIKTDDGDITEGVSQVSWTGGRIRPGEFQDFPLSVRIPGRPGDTLTFKAIQRYDDGEVVRWIGPPDSDEPAARTTITEQAVPVDTLDVSSGKTASPTAAASSDETDGGGRDGLTLTIAIVAAVLAAIGLGFAVAAWHRGRARSASA